MVKQAAGAVGMSMVFDLAGGGARPGKNPRGTDAGTSHENSRLETLIGRTSLLFCQYVQRVRDAECDGVWGVVRGVWRGVKCGEVWGAVRRMWDVESGTQGV